MAAGRLQLGALVPDLTEETGVLDGEGRLGGERLQDVHDLRRKLAGGFPVEGQAADDLVLAEQGASVSRAAFSAIASNPAAVFGRPAQGPAPPMHRGSADRQSLDLLQFLSRMAVIEISVRRPQQQGYPLAQAPGQPPPRRPAAAAVQQPLGPLRLEAAAQAADLSIAQVQGRRHLGPCHPSRHQGFEQPCSRGFLLAHRECLPWVHGRTLSLNS